MQIINKHLIQIMNHDAQKQGFVFNHLLEQRRFPNCTDGALWSPSGKKKWRCVLPLETLTKDEHTRPKVKTAEGSLLKMVDRRSLRWQENNWIRTFYNHIWFSWVLKRKLLSFFPWWILPSNHGFQSIMSMLAVAYPASNKHLERAPFPENTSTAL